MRFFVWNFLPYKVDEDVSDVLERLLVLCPVRAQAAQERRVGGPFELRKNVGEAVLQALRQVGVERLPTLGEDEVVDVPVELLVAHLRGAGRAVVQDVLHGRPDDVQAVLFDLLSLLFEPTPFAIVIPSFRFLSLPNFVCPLSISSVKCCVPDLRALAL